MVSYVGISQENVTYQKPSASILTLADYERAPSVIMDTKKQYNLFLNIRGNNDYPYNNLFLIVAMEQPDKKTLVDTLEYQMANPDGSLLGEGFTDVKESKLVYKERMKFKKGNYKIHIRHAVRQTGKVAGVAKLDGITEVGFRIEKIE